MYFYPSVLLLPPALVDFQNVKPDKGEQSQSSTLQRRCISHSFSVHTDFLAGVRTFVFFFLRISEWFNFIFRNEKLHERSTKWPFVCLFVSSLLKCSSGFILTHSMVQDIT
jgi:hypothetical protein